MCSSWKALYTVCQTTFQQERMAYCKVFVMLQNPQNIKCATQGSTWYMVTPVTAEDSCSERITITECVSSKARSWEPLCSGNSASAAVGNLMLVMTMVIVACNSQGRRLYVLNFHPPSWSSPLHLLLPCSIHTAVCTSSVASGRILVCGSSQTKLSRKFH